MLKTSDFEKFADENLVLVKFNYPRSGAARANAAEAKREFKFGSYPTVVLLDYNGKEIKRMSGFGGQSPSEYISTIQQIVGR